MSVLLLTPPLLQCNSPYPATPMLTAWLRARGHRAAQADLSIELALKIFCEKGLREAAEVMRSRHPARRKRPPPPSVHSFLDQADDYFAVIDEVIAFLQGKSPESARAFASRKRLPEGPRFAVVDTMRAVGALDWLRGPQLKAAYFASLLIDDLADALREGVDARFGLSRYAERLAVSAASFAPIAAELAAPPSIFDQMLDGLVDDVVAKHRPTVVGMTVPFPGNLLGALRIARRIKTVSPKTSTVLGGGFVNTELRGITEPAVFDHVDYLVYDDGERPLERVVAHAAGLVGDDQLLRTRVRRGGQVVWVEGVEEQPLRHRDRPPPTFDGLPLAPYVPQIAMKNKKSTTSHKAGRPPDDRTTGVTGMVSQVGLRGSSALYRYFSMIETPNPMSHLWTERRWNKLMLAHGCYWRKCAFCDTSLDYIGRFDPADADTIVAWIESMIEESGSTGFHFVDEAAPPALLAAVAERLVSRGLGIQWWANIRFDKAFTPELARLLVRSGCVAVTGGLECATMRLLRLMDKGGTLEQAARVARNFSAAGALVHLYLMFGFPTQTLQDSVDSLEFVRQLFESDCAQSAFWHRFALTVHSRIFASPEAYGIKPCLKKGIRFASNEVPFEDSQSVDHEAIGVALNKAVYNYMHGNMVDADVRNWFEEPTPKPRIAKSFVRQAIRVSG